MNSYHWAQGIIDFPHNSSQVLHLTPRGGGGWKCFPRCSLYLKYLVSAPSLWGRLRSLGGLSNPPFHQLSECADGGTCSIFLITLRELCRGFLIFSGQMPKAPLFRPGSQGWGNNTGHAHHEMHINIITTLSEFTVAMSTKQLGKLGLWEIGK